MIKLIKILFVVFLIILSLNIWLAFSNTAAPQVEAIAESAMLDIPIISQLPELPRGCEVTSLAMLLRHAGINIDKMELAEKIEKVPFEQNGLRGDPNDGFVGNMYNLNKPGLGVFHKPIVRLAENYLPGRIKDLSGCDFENILESISVGYPVWVINNTKYDFLPEEYWETWETKNGDISITYKEHSVLVTGYDSEFIYFNDPLAGQKNRAVNRDNFIKGWRQMGAQAVTYE